MLRPAPLAQTVEGSGRWPVPRRSARATACQLEGVGAERAQAEETLQYERFRRAIYEADQRAWASLYHRYRGQVLAWTRSHSAWALVASRGDDDYWATLAFERLWLAMRPQHFHRFATLEALLAYLKMCAISVVLDEARSRTSRASKDAPSGAPSAEESAYVLAAGAIETIVLQRAEKVELWRAVVRALPDDSSRLVAYLSFVAGRAPREIAALHSERFPNVEDVYRTKRKLLERLRHCVAVNALRVA
jgi:hypothetical protein